jgi:2-keto-4-pentenoate hydratase/2-oxohepta-3-ene-1,7-dioic acid hydratase in catechol pathway
MRFLRFRQDCRLGLAAARPGQWFAGFLEGEAGYPGDLTPALLSAHSLAQIGARLLEGRRVDAESVERLPPVARANKIICVGLNYRDHAAEAGHKLPEYPAIFSRFESSLIGDGALLRRPRVSSHLDFEGELVAVIGKGGRHIPHAEALDHVAGYSLFNDGSVRDFQRRTTQWTMGKNFDGTGAFGPWLVSADELPPGAQGRWLETRLNGTIVQRASTSDMLFDVQTLVSQLSEAMTLEAGDVLVTGTPSGVGMARMPPLWMKPGDLCEVSIEGIGILRNRVEEEQLA